MSLVLVTGPRRSGKSRVAERLAAAPGAPVTYLAPALPADDEMRERVAVHRARRLADWRTLEAVDPAAALARIAPGETVLLDSLGSWVTEALWTAGALEPGADAAPALAALAGGVAAFAGRAARRPGLVVVVSEEAGWAPVPPDQGTRRWLDALGDAARECSRQADRVLLVVAGRELELA